MLGQLVTSMLAVASASAFAACERSDLACRGAEGHAAATAACVPHIERLSRYSVRWTDAMGKPVFSRFNWTNEPGGPVTYIGDQVEFQIATGAYQPMRYLCDMDADGRRVLGARAYEGRLPLR